MGSLPKHQEESERRIFLLTLLKNGHIKADRMRTDKDPRLRSRTAFALITLEAVLPAGDESNLSDSTKPSGGSVEDERDEAYLLRRRIAESMEDFRGIFHALRKVKEDTILEFYRTGLRWAGWRVFTNRTWVN